MDINELKSLALLIGPFVLPRAIGWIKSRRNRKNSAIAPKTRAVVIFLIAWSFIQIVWASYLRKWGVPENIVWMTGSRIQTPPEVLRSRLKSIRVKFSKDDDRLISQLMEHGSSAMSMYSMHGPAVGQCIWCNALDNTSYVIYRLPELALPFLVNFVVMLCLTSARVDVARRLRSYWLMAIIGCFVSELWPLTRSQDPDDWIFWTKYARGWVLTSMISTAFAGVIYFRQSETSVEKTLKLAQDELDSAFRTLSLIGVLQNSKRETDWSRNQQVNYWNHQAEFKNELKRSEIYQEARNDAKAQVSQSDLHELANSMVDRLNELTG